MRNELVSMIVICKNNASTIRRCLDSILAQTYSNIEIVVVDSSNDETRDILQEYEKQSNRPFKLIFQQPLGVAVARNTGIENASGEVLIFVDADCYIEPSFVEKIIKPFKQSEKVLSVYTSMIQVVPKGLFPNLVYLYERIMHYNRTVDTARMIGTYVVRKKLYEKIGKYNPELKSGEDMEFFNRLIKRKEELLSQGYIFAQVRDAKYYEEKQGLGFFEYYKKCIWYGEPLTNMQYFRSDLITNMARTGLSIYTFLLPFFIIGIFASNLASLIIIVLIPLLIFFGYILIKATIIGFLRWIIILMPILIIYKFVGIFIGIIKGAFK